MELTTERRLMRMMAAHGIEQFECKGAWGHISLTLEGPLHPEIRTTQAGRFTLGSANRNFPRTVRKGEFLAFLSIGPVLLPIVATHEALLLPPIVADGSIAGYGDVLF